MVPASGKGTADMRRRRSEKRLQAYGAGVREKDRRQKRFAEQIGKAIQI
jgi:hypothetical protein